MAVNTTQGFSFQLVADGEILDLFKDEEIRISDNITGLFDIGVLPSDFTQVILLPGTKKNNAFFKHVYDISVESPFLFQTNRKVNCYFDFGSIYLANGYLQLNKVNVLQNKFIDSYEITVYGSLSSFARELNRAFLTDLDNLSIYNHTSSLQNITGSWESGLFNGDIVYPLIDYGQGYQYTPENPNVGIDSPNGAITVQDFKPAIRAKVVWDAIFEKYGYTYSGSFFNKPWLDNIYLVCNNKLKYPVYESVDLENYGLFKISPLSASGQTNLTLNPSIDNSLPWFRIESNPSNLLNESLVYTVEKDTKLRGNIQLNLRIETDKSGSITEPGNGVPQFDLVVKSFTTSSITPLENINQQFVNILNFNETITRDQTLTLSNSFTTQQLPSGSYTFNIRYSVLGDDNFSVILNPNDSVNSFLEVTKVNQAADGLVLDIPSNMPFGEQGVKLIDFITSIQKKFNLIIYPSKTRPNEFIIETFNEWYNRGKVRDFNKFINLDESIEVIPANNLAVNELNFGDKLDKDYISKEFQELENREYGKTYFIDTENFYSQGKFEVQTGFASSPLLLVNGTGASGSAFLKENVTFTSDATATSQPNTFTSARGDIRVFTSTVVSATATARRVGETVNEVDTIVRPIESGDQLTFEASFDGDGTGTYQFTKVDDFGTTVLDSGIGNRTFVYNVSVSDTTSTVLQFKNLVESGVV